MTDRRRGWLVLEAIALYVGVPLAYRLGWLPVPLPLLLWLPAATCLILLLRDPGFDNRELWDTRPLRRFLPGILLRFALVAAVLLSAVWWFTPDRLFSFVRHRPGLWAVVMVLYPIFSVYPQGVVYRSFLLHRYGPLLPPGLACIVTAAAAFGFMHILFQNLVAVVLTFLGGILFIRTHLRSGSLLVSSIEHALYGCLIFTAGWGWYFYHGALQAP